MILKKLILLNTIMNTTVASDDAVRLTMLLPINKVINERSYPSRTFITNFADLLPPSAFTFILMRLQQENAVSVALKKAEKIIKTSMIKSVPIKLLGLLILNTCDKGTSGSILKINSFIKQQYYTKFP